MHRRLTRSPGRIHIIHTVFKEGCDLNMDTKFHVLEMETSVQQGIKVDLCSRHFDHKDSVLINRLMPLSKGTAAGI